MSALTEKLERIADMADAENKPHWAMAMIAASIQLTLWEKEIKLLREDKERLDWLADKRNSIGNVELPKECVSSRTVPLDVVVGRQGDTK